jgi:hypothetical protein
MKDPTTDHKRWLSFREATEIVRGHLGGASIGKSQAMVRAALASGEVRHDRAHGCVTIDGHVLLSAWDGIIGGRGQGFPSRISRDDLIDWLERQNLLTPAQARARDVSACRKWLVEERRRPPRQRKAEYQAEAKGRFGIGPGQFRVVWESAALESPSKDWGKAGAPAKKRIVRK